MAKKPTNLTFQKPREKRQERIEIKGTDTRAKLIMNAISYYKRHVDEQSDNAALTDEDRKYFFNLGADYQDLITILYRAKRVDIICIPMPFMAT